LAGLDVAPVVVEIWFEVSSSIVNVIQDARVADGIESIELIRRGELSIELSDSCRHQGALSLDREDAAAASDEGQSAQAEEDPQECAAQTSTGSAS
jgi:hypothetical protein